MAVGIRYFAKWLTTSVPIADDIARRHDEARMCKSAANPKAPQLRITWKYIYSAKHMEHQPKIEIINKTTNGNRESVGSECAPFSAFVEFMEFSFG